MSKFFMALLHIKRTFEKVFWKVPSVYNFDALFNSKCWLKFSPDLFQTISNE